MTNLKFTIPVTNGTNYVVVNLPTALTIQNRKLHRSCLEYQVNGGYIYDSNNAARIKLGAAPNTWPVRAAIKRARNHWLTMHKETFQNNPQLKPKWHDFKMALTKGQMDGSYTTYNVPEDIFDNNVRHNSHGITWSVFTTENGISASVNPVTGAGMVETDKDEFTSHLLGSHLGPATNFTSIGALTSWINSRPDLEPVTTISDAESDAMQDDPLNMLFNDGDADNEIIENLHNAVDGDGDMDGDIYPPYHLTNPLDTVMETASAALNSSTTVAYFTGFKALLGQVFLKIVSTGSGNVDVMFDVNPKGMTI